MSWDSHIEAMKASGAEDACISDLNGNMWAKSSGFNASPQEIAIAIKAARGQDLSDSEKLEFNKVAFMKIRSLDGDHTGSMFVSKNEGEKVFCCAALSNQTVVMVTKTGQGKNQAVEICEREVKYLKESGY